MLTEKEYTNLTKGDSIWLIDKKNLHIVSLCMFDHYEPQYLGNFPDTFHVTTCLGIKKELNSNDDLIFLNKKEAYKYAIQLCIKEINCHQSEIAKYKTSKKNLFITYNNLIIN